MNPMVLVAAQRQASAAPTAGATQERRGPEISWHNNALVLSLRLWGLAPRPEDEGRGGWHRLLSCRRALQALRG